jgi:ribose 5-phosphate isomerase B
MWPLRHALLHKMTTPVTSSIIHLACDHAGFVSKEMVRHWLEEDGVVVVDHGATTHNEVDDFPDFISKAAQAVSSNPAAARAIIFGGSGQGEAMVANRYPHVRATVYYGGDESIVMLSRQHNDANVLSIGARFVDEETIKRVVTLWLAEPFSQDEKYERRNQKIERITRQL